MINNSSDALVGTHQAVVVAASAAESSEVLFAPEHGARHDAALLGRRGAPVVDELDRNARECIELLVAAGPGEALLAGAGAATHRDRLGRGSRVGGRRGLDHLLRRLGGGVDLGRVDGGGGVVLGRGRLGGVQGRAGDGAALGDRAFPALAAGVGVHVGGALMVRTRTLGSDTVDLGGGGTGDRSKGDGDERGSGHDASKNGHCVKT